MTSIRALSQRLPVSVKLLSPPFILFLGLWSVGVVGFGYFANDRLEESARQKTIDTASLLQKDFQQRQKLLGQQTRWLSEDPDVMGTLAVNDHSQLSSRLLKHFLGHQAELELNLIRIVAPDGQSFVSSQQGAIASVKLQDASIRSAAQTGLELSGILPAEATAPTTLVHLISLKSSTKILATLITGITVDDQLLHEMRHNTSIHLVALQSDRVTATTLPLDRQQSWQFPAADGTVTWIEIGDATYSVKTFELTGFDQTKLKIAVLNPITNLEQAESQMFLTVGGFGLLGAGLFIGVTAFGVRLTQTLSRRIQGLTQATQRLAQGDLSIRLPIDAQDEVGALAQGFNTMAEQLTARDQQLQHQMAQLQSTLKELHQTQSQMVQSEKMSALGQMVGGVAHEINNPIGFIHSNLGYLQQYSQDLLQLLQSYQHHYPQPPASLQAELEAVDLEFLTIDLAKILQSMHIGSARIRDIVLSLRNFSRLDEAECKLANLHEGIDSTLMILQHRLKGTPELPVVEVVKHYGQLPLVKCYPGHLNQVFMNLLANAIDALEAATQSSRSSVITISTNVVENHQVQITIADNGVGIPEAVRPRIFDPFFTTKPIGKGTGLGLSISYQIVTDRHHGKMWCDSTPGEGSKFVIEIPIGD